MGPSAGIALSLKSRIGGHLLRSRTVPIGILFPWPRQPMVLPPYLMFWFVRSAFFWGRCCATSGMSVFPVRACRGRIRAGAFARSGAGERCGHRIFRSQGHRWSLAGQRPALRQDLHRSERPRTPGDRSAADGRTPAGATGRRAKAFTVTADQIGQVFSIALDDATPPNIYAAATSAYGLPDRRSR